MAKQDAPVDPEVQKWLDENAISTGKADMNLVVTEGQKETKIPVMKSILAVEIETIEKNTSEHGDCRKLKDATKKFLALARHLLSFYPGTPAKGDAAANKGKGKK